MTVSTVYIEVVMTTVGGNLIWLANKISYFPNSIPCLVLHTEKSYAGESERL